MPPILRSRASALASLLAITSSSRPASPEPLTSLRGFGGLLDGASSGGFTDPPAGVSGKRQRRADIFDRLEL